LLCIRRIPFDRLYVLRKFIWLTLQAKALKTGLHLACSALRYIATANKKHFQLNFP
jgi:hypothetical protein